MNKYRKTKKGNEMKGTNTETHFPSCILHFSLCILLILLAACGGGSGSSDKASSDTGSIALSLTWEGTTKEGAAIYQAAKFDCTGNGVDTVEATVSDESDTLESGGPWDCVAGTGTIEGVQAGSNRRVVVFGLNSNDDVLYRGEQSGITVTAGEITQAEITMNYVGDTLIWDLSNWDDANWG